MSFTTSDKYELVTLTVWNMLKDKHQRVAKPEKKLLLIYLLVQIASVYSGW